MSLKSKCYVKDPPSLEVMIENSIWTITIAENPSLKTNFSSKWNIYKKSSWFNRIVATENIIKQKFPNKF